MLGTFTLQESKFLGGMRKVMWKAHVLREQENITIVHVKVRLKKIQAKNSLKMKAKLGKQN